jgi:hypothetical protein
MVVPLQHGFPRHFALGNLGASSLGDLADGWTQDTYPTFRALCKRALDLASSSTDLPFFNWYELVAELARQTAIPPKHMKTAGYDPDPEPDSAALPNNGGTDSGGQLTTCGDRIRASLP